VGLSGCAPREPWSRIARTLRFSEFALATVHRAENVDDREVLRNIAEAMMGAPVPVVMPVHPRTRKRLEEHGLWGPFSENDNVQALPITALAKLRGLNAPTPEFIPSSLRIGPFTTIILPKEVVELGQAASCVEQLPI
jgi:hypothetical protein